MIEIIDHLSDSDDLLRLFDFSKIRQKINIVIQFILQHLVHIERLSPEMGGALMINDEDHRSFLRC